jgi:YHS domain-containing protein
MTTSQNNLHLGEESNGETACGARINLTPTTPFIHYHDQVVYFCGQDCLQLYEEDPMNSCMAARLLSGK